MRTALVGVVSAAALLLSSAPAVAAATTRVDGDHFGASGLRLINQGCSDPTTKPDKKPRFLVKRGGSHVGSRSVGWHVRETGYGVGPAAKVTSPSTTTVYKMKLFSPDAQVSGLAVVSYYAPNDAGVWVGTSNVTTDTVRGWHTVDASGLGFGWRHYTDGVLDQTAPVTKLAAFVTQHGGDGDGAYLGFAYGCDGSDFYIDALSVGRPKHVRTYDFEGFGTRTYLTTGGERRKSISITYGQKMGFTAHLRTLVGDDGKAATLRFEDKPYSAKHWSLVDKRTVTGNGNLQVPRQPRHQVSYRVSYPGNTTWEASRSNVLKVLVRAKIHASIVDPTVTKGHSFVTAGRFLPGRIGKVQLQRFVHKHWTTIKAIRSGKDGGFRISNLAKPVGVSYWRVQVVSGGGNLAAHTPAMKLTVKEPPSSGGSTPPPSDPPPPPPDDPPPPPPPTH